MYFFREYKADWLKMRAEKLEEEKRSAEELKKMKGLFQNTSLYVIVCPVFVKRSLTLSGLKFVLKKRLKDLN